MLILSFSFTAQSQEKYSNAFLELGVGARAHGQGTSVVARAGDATAGYWNPALLPLMPASFQVNFMHAEWFGGVAKLDYAGFAKKLETDRPSALGFSIIRLGVDQIPNTLGLVETDGTINFDRLSAFSAADYAFFLSYGRQLSNRGPNHQLLTGGSVKIIRRQVGRFGNAWGFGLDAGLLLKRRYWQVGIMARDVSFTFNAWQFSLNDAEKATFLATGNDLPVNRLEITYPRFIPGFAWLPRASGLWKFELELDVHITTDGRRNTLLAGDILSFDPCLGAEVQFRERVWIRGGVLNFQKVEKILEDGTSLVFQPTFGMGLQAGRVKLDYAFTDLGDFSPILYAHLFSLQIDFNPKKRP